MPIKPGQDKRIAFRPISVSEGEVVSLTVDVTGGPIARVQVIVVDANGKVTQGVGSHEFGEPLTTENGGRVRWSFVAGPGLSHVKWGVTAVRSGANLADYTVASRLSDTSGRTLESGRFDAVIPDKKSNDDIQFDGSKLALVPAPTSLDHEAVL
ncbi:hypothetical protein [Roseateles sp. L2-2]|uniref:hypothetical protein n=1 Tax=Roseateles TaxID=93681 RepID=UPI003D36CD5A